MNVENVERNMKVIGVICLMMLKGKLGEIIQHFGLDISVKLIY